MKNPTSCWNGFCILLLMSCFALTGTSVAQNQYYIAPTGSDSNDGSKAHPWATINHADAALTVGPGGNCVSGTGWETAKGIPMSGIGACVHVASGTYAQSVFNTKAGTASARIRYISDTQYGARILGDNSAGTIWSNHGGYTDIVGFDIDGSTTTVQNGIFNIYDGAGVGCFAQVLANKIHDICDKGSCRQGPGGMGTGGQSLTSLTSSCGNVYRGNLVYHINGGGSSTFNDGSANGGHSGGWGDIVQDNIFIDIGGMCVGEAHTSTNLIITNNTIINCARNGILLANTTGLRLNDFSTVTNNIIANSGLLFRDPGIRIFSTGGCGPHNVYANNLIYGNGQSGYEFDSCPNTATGTVSGSNSTTFVNYTGTISGDYHLKAGSMAIGGGTTACAAGAGICAHSVDFAGNARLQASDIGSYAFAVTGAPAAPTGLTASVQ